jgi:hypothetical protein
VIKLGAIVKLARAKIAPGGIGAEELAEMVAELASSFGMELEMVPVLRAEAEEAFHRAALITLRADSKIVSLRGKMRSGDRLEGVIVLSPMEASPEAPEK